MEQLFIGIATIAKDEKILPSSAQGLCMRKSAARHAGSGLPRRSRVVDHLQSFSRARGQESLPRVVGVFLGFGGSGGLAVCAISIVTPFCTPHSSGGGVGNGAIKGALRSQIEDKGTGDRTTSDFSRKNALRFKTRYGRSIDVILVFDSFSWWRAACRTVSISDRFWPVVGPLRRQNGRQACHKTDRLVSGIRARSRGGDSGRKTPVNNQKTPRGDMFAASMAMVAGQNRTRFIFLRADRGRTLWRAIN